MTAKETLAMGCLVLGWKSKQLTAALAANRPIFRHKLDAHDWRTIG